MMLRAAGRLLLIGILTLTIVGSAAAAPNNQVGALPATIVAFSADASSVNYADVEAGKAQVTLSWQTVNTDPKDSLVLEDFVQSSWVSVTDANETLAFNGSKKIGVALPQNFGAPTYRLTLKSDTGAMLAQQFLTIPYAPSAESAPSIAAFTTTVLGIDTNLLVQNNVKINIAWQVTNRQPDTLIRFDQVQDDGTTVSAELARPALWLPSQGDGVLVPRPSASKNQLEFRMSLVNLHDGTVYDHKDITIPVVGNVVIAAPHTAGSGGNQITVSHTVTDGNVVLTWNANGAQTVNVLENVQGGPKNLYIELPPSGSLQIPLPANSPGVTYTLQAQDANGNVTTGKVNVNGG